MTEHAVVIAGGGPTGMMLAGELALAGIDVAIVERRTPDELMGTRGTGLHARTIEVLDQRGIAERFTSQGKTYPVVLFNGKTLDISDFPSRHNYVLGLLQHHTERILAEWISELPVTIYRGRAVTGFVQDETGVDVTLADGETLRGQYLVGCDGGRSVIRKLAGIAFPGWDADTSWLIAEAEVTEEPKWGFFENALGSHAIAKAENGKSVRMVLVEAQAGGDKEPTLHDIREALIGIYGTDFGIHSPTWISRFTDMARQAAAYRDRRVLLAGDSAHVHAPLGGQGLNLGVQDAVNLGWKLAQVVKRSSPETLLDSYQAERHPVAARVLRNTMAQVALRRKDDRSKALSDMFAELLGMNEPRRYIVAEVSGLGIYYDLGEGHPLLGRRMPDLDLVTETGPVRVFALLHDARAVLINFGEAKGIDIPLWSDRVQLIDAEYTGVWELPVIGAVSAPGAVLVRPDGYVAWVGDGRQIRLAEALTTWFGPPRTE